MRHLRCRYGHASKAEKAAAERVALHAFLKRHSDLLDGRGGPLTKFEAHDFAKLAWKYKYDPEFQDEMMVRHAGKPGPAPKHEDMPVMSNKVRRPGYAD